MAKRRKNKSLRGTEDNEQSFLLEHPFVSFLLIQSGAGFGAYLVRTLILKARGLE
ncbi:MAG: hypothetical protein MJZ30_10090 [Paludibacteraceae bacterium]|nr:hypothetical protein [Paludibacteraceae bacterium]